MLFKIARMYRKFASNSHKPHVFKNILFVQVSTVRNTMMTTNENQLGLFSVIDKTTTSEEKISI